jgi:hypothetical protein
MFAIGELINQIIAGDKKRKRKIIEQLGYSNINKGFKRLNKLINSGICHEDLRMKLPDALDLKPEIVEKVFADTNIQIQQKKEKIERAHFNPHLFLEHERSRPSQITMCAVTGGVERWKKVRLPEEIFKEDWDDQVCIVQKTIEQHQQNEESQRGFFGKVTAYVYRPIYEKSVLFSISGEVVNLNYGKVVEPKSSVTVGGRDISRILNPM